MESGGEGREREDGSRAGLLRWHEWEDRLCHRGRWKAGGEVGFVDIQSRRGWYTGRLTGVVRGRRE